MSKRTAPVLERGMVPIAKMVEAPYNPRTIDDKAMKGLKASLDRFGLVQEIVLNRRTGHIVGGHQRVAALRVAGVTEAPAVWVDLSDRDEKALNVALNSQHISGEFTAGLQGILDELKMHDLGMFEDLRLDELCMSWGDLAEIDMPDIGDNERPVRQNTVVVIVGDEDLECINRAIAIVSPAAKSKEERGAGLAAVARRVSGG